MVKIMENPVKTDDLGGKPTIFGSTSIWTLSKLEKTHDLSSFFFGGEKSIIRLPGLTIYHDTQKKSNA